MPHNLPAQLRSFRAKTDVQRRIQAFLRDNLALLNSLSLDEIADATGTSQPSVTRVMRELGYDNSLALRTAAAQHQPGRLSPGQVREAGDLMRRADDLHIYCPSELDAGMKTLFGGVFRKTDTGCPMKPQVRRRRDLPHRTANTFNDGDGMLVIGVDALPEGYDFDVLFQHAAERSVTVIILQAVAFEMAPSGSLNVFCLELQPDTHRDLATVYLTAGVADIRSAAARYR